MDQFDQQVEQIETVYQSRIRVVLERSDEEVLSSASVALFVSGILSHMHRVDDPIMATFERVPEFLCLAERVTEGAAVGDIVKLVIPQEKPFFGVLVSREGLVFYYQGNGPERGCRIDSITALKAQLNPKETRVYRRRDIITND